LNDTNQYLGVKIRITISIATQLLISLKEDVGSKIENKFVIMFNFFDCYSHLTCKSFFVHIEQKKYFLEIVTTISSDTLKYKISHISGDICGIKNYLIGYLGLTFPYF